MNHSLLTPTCLSVRLIGPDDVINRLWIFLRMPPLKDIRCYGAVRLFESI